MKIFTGHVIATKTAKTAVVSVERVIIHPLYKKRFNRDRKYPVHDEIGVKVNDLVKFTACRPYSKTKKWIILEVVGDKKAVAKKTVEKVVEKKVTVKKEKVPGETAKASHGIPLDASKKLSNRERRVK